MQLLRKKWVAAAIVGLFQLAISAQTTVVLQQGTGDYTGCSDAYFGDEGTSSGTSASLDPKYEKCAS